MKFVQRFAYYLVGLVIGCFFVALVFSGKDTRCNYFPNARVLNDLRNKPFHYSENANKVLGESWVTIADIRNTLEFGDVNFDKSDTEFGKKTKIYIIEGKTLKGQEIILKVKNEEGKATLEEIIKK
ncbi:hypothetical protein GCM10008015_10950 [Flavobacterium palustre]|uniref:DUF4258 domain-containing protein n=1 Tax=Flavobacterium palustre TaxID=1476463 RepID=A0ABQ1HEB9_9FLAO|nr:DUF4258 domain-containing protein [Flavobacterium palustre]GGA72088.1 hypothetical protein GCM10008015_10950 [Flavobacterium palustre]